MPVFTDKHYLFIAKDYNELAGLIKSHFGMHWKDVLTPNWRQYADDDRITLVWSQRDWEERHPRVPRSSTYERSDRSVLVTAKAISWELHYKKGFLAEL